MSQSVPADEAGDPAAPPPPVPLAEAVRVWARVAALSFGGPAGQIAVMHRILVEEKRWLGERRFLHALNYCMLLPVRRSSAPRCAPRSLRPRQRRRRGEGPCADSVRSGAVVGRWACPGHRFIPSGHG